LQSSLASATTRERDDLRLFGPVARRETGTEIKIGGDAMNPGVMGCVERGTKFRLLKIHLLMISAGIATGLACSKNNSMDNCPAVDSGASDTPVAVEIPDAQVTADPLAGLPTAQQITFTTLFKSPQVIEGLTADSAGNLYSAGRLGTPCGVFRVPSGGGTGVLVGNIMQPCNANGLVFNPAGDLFIGEGDHIWKLTPNEQSPPTATAFATGVPSANGLAFDKGGNLWASDGTTGQGRVWRIAGDGTPTEVFRTQAMANDANVVVTGADGGTDGGGTMVGGVGRDPRALPPGTLTFTAAGRAAADTNGSVGVVANGLAFTADGRTLFVADTARGAIWKVTFDAQGALTSPVGCDTTFSADTLCLTNVFVAHPYLEGLDGIALDVAGNIWGVANERQAVVVVTPAGAVREVFRNSPSATTKLRNTGPLEFPTSPFLVDKKLCITQSDTSRRDNAPNTLGEVGPGIAGPVLGKISCMDQLLPQAGLVLPIR
jgi:sugar lactone lactonase YvrE